MQFEWDEGKNEINLVKHDLDFADAELVFGGPMLQAPAIDQDYGEERWIAIGLLEAIVVFVVFTRREPDIIRVISMQKRLNRTNPVLKARSKTNWEALESKTDEEIDTSDIPLQGDDFFARAQLVMPDQEWLALPVDAEVLAWFKTHDGEFRARIDAALRSYMEANRER